jgi:hypothetical protein
VRSGVCASGSSETGITAAADKEAPHPCDEGENRDAADSTADDSGTRSRVSAKVLDMRDVRCVRDETHEVLWVVVAGRVLMGREAVEVGRAFVLSFTP